VREILVALDVDSVAQARELADRLRGAVGGFKIGSRLFTSDGPSFVRELAARVDRVFLDLKFHDIPNTVAGAVAAATRLGVWMVNVHASGGRAMMRAAREAADREAGAAGREAPLLIAVTMLTSLVQRDIEEVGFDVPMIEQVERLAALAQAAGLDGVVASPQEIEIIRRRCGPEFQIVTPGIRPHRDPAAAAIDRNRSLAKASAERDDQSRTMTAAGALAAGANYLVVGRPIIGAADPLAAAEQISLECGPARR